MRRRSPLRAPRALILCLVLASSLPVPVRAEAKGPGASTAQTPRSRARALRAELEAIPASSPARRRRFRSWRRAAKRAGASRGALRAIARAEATIDGFARRPRRADLDAALGKLREARRGLRRAGFPARGRWAAALEMLVKVRSGAPERALRRRRIARADPATERLVHRARAEAHLALGQPESAVGEAAAHDRAGAPEAALLNPTPLLERACAALPDTGAVTLCPRLVHEATGAFLVSKHDDGRPVGARSAELLDRIHGEATVFLQDCLRAEARTAPGRMRGARLEVSWTVDDEGRARAPEVRPRRHRELLEGCLPERLEWLRYPRLANGAHENVSMVFSID